MSRGFADAWGPGDARVERLQQFIDDITIIDDLQDKYSYVPPTTPGTWTRSGTGLGKTVWTNPTWNTWTATPSSWERPRPCKRALKYRPPTSSRIWPMCNGVDLQATRSIQQNTQPPRPAPLGAPGTAGQQWTMYTGINVMGTRPSSPSPGDTYFDVNSGEMRTWTGTHWAQLSTGLTAHSHGFPEPGLAITNLAQSEQPKPWWKRGWKK